MPPPSHSSFAGGPTVNYDLHALQRARAESHARSASADRRARLKSRDDATLAALLGTTHGDMLARASERRAAETVSRHAERVADLLQRPGSRMAMLARLPGGETASLAASRGFPATPHSPHALPPSARQASLLRGAFSGLLEATAASGLAGGAALDASASAHPAAGLGATAKAQLARMEAERRGASASAARRKHAALHAGGVGPRDAPRDPAASPTRRLPSRLARRGYMLDVGGGGGEEGGGGGAAVLPPPMGVDEFGLPMPLSLAPAERRAYEAARAEGGGGGSGGGGSPAGSAGSRGGGKRRPRAASPFAPGNLLRTLPPTPPPRFAHAAEAGVPIPGSHSYNPDSHSFRDRNPARELGPSRAVTGSLSAEPRRVFVRGRPGLVDGEATARVEEEARLRATSPAAHPFLATKAARAEVHGPWSPPIHMEPTDGGVPRDGDAAARAASIGRPYMLLPATVRELAVGVDAPWAAWASPLPRAPDDLRGWAPPAARAAAGGGGGGSPSPRAPPEAAAESARSLAPSSGAEAALLASGVPGVSPRCSHRDAGCGHGFSPAALAARAAGALGSTGGTPRAPRSQSAHPARGGGGGGAAAAATLTTSVHFTSPRAPPSPRSLLPAAQPRAAASLAINVADFAASGVDPLLEASRAAAPCGLPPALSTVPSRWEGPWQGGPAHYDRFPTSPFRDGRDLYRRAHQGREASAEELAAASVAAAATLSPRSTARLAATGAGVDARLAAPSPREQLQAVAPGAAAAAAVAAAAPGGTAPWASPPGKVPLGSLGASLARREAERALAEALHPGGKFLGLPSPRAAQTSARSDFGRSVRSPL
jgi:hypothetical protein